MIIQVALTVSSDSFGLFLCFLYLLFLLNEICLCDLQSAFWADRVDLKPFFDAFDVECMALAGEDHNLASGRELVETNGAD